MVIIRPNLGLHSSNHPKGTSSFYRTESAGVPSQRTGGGEIGGWAGSGVMRIESKEDGGMWEIYFFLRVMTFRYVLRVLNA